MATMRNLLIVEDDQEWRDAYSRTAAKSGAFRVKVAEDLLSAKALIDEIQFAVAFIDIGLDVNDDQNVDGLLVMEKIRSIDEATSIVVVTGRSGRDVMPITRAALKRFKAFDIVPKGGTEPAEIRRLLLTGLEEFEKQLGKQLQTHPSGRESLRGAEDPQFWDDEMLRMTNAKGGAKGFYGFIDRLLAPYIPLIASEAGAGVHSDPATRLVHGAFWSRAIGQGIVVCFGPEDKLADPVSKAKEAKLLLDRYRVGEVLEEHSAHGLSGVVFALSETARDQFAASVPS